MALNQFLPFATGAGANVLSEDEYANMLGRAEGFVSGLARSIECNTVWRQASFVTAMIGQFIADYAQEDALDNGDIPGLEQKFVDALRRLMHDSYHIQAFGVPGIYYPPAGTSLYLVEVWGAGAGSAAGYAPSSWASAGGAGGGYARKLVRGPIGETVVTVGAGGIAGSTGWLPAPGGTTSFGAYVAATGGQNNGGLSISGPCLTGYPGVGYGGDVNVAGSWSGPPTASINGAGNIGGFGGGGAMGGGFASGNVGESATGIFPGGGGGGVGPSATSGMPGANGMVVVLAW